MALLGVGGVPVWVAWAAMAVAVAALWGAMWSLGRGLPRTRYQPLPWGAPEMAVFGAALACALGLAAAAVIQVRALNPPYLDWPALPWPAGVGLVAAMAPVAVPHARPVPVPLGVSA
jgi:hypothetical protein